MMEAVALADQYAFKGELLKDEPMARHTSWRVGGPAKVFYKPLDCADMVAFLQAGTGPEPLLWLGLGSNLLVRDAGFNGRVILTTPALKEMNYKPKFRIHVQAGVACAKLARFAASHDLAGAEFFCGIPGTMGGALAMNAGAFGGETWDVVSMVETVDSHGQIRQRDAGEFNVGYRTVKSPAQEWFVAAELELHSGDGASSRKEMKRLLKQRGKTQPTQFPNAGSVFRNPKGDYAARLIEASGLKGTQIGGAVVSDKHANFIINTGHAQAADIEALIEMIIKTVHEKFSVLLEPEVRIVGEKLTP